MFYVIVVLWTVGSVSFRFTICLGLQFVLFFMYVSISEVFIIYIYIYMYQQFLTLIFALNHLQVQFSTLMKGL